MIDVIVRRILSIIYYTCAIAMLLLLQVMIAPIFAMGCLTSNKKYFKYLSWFTCIPFDFIHKGRQLWENRYKHDEYFDNLIKK